jgi:hypothetical protein
MVAQHKYKADSMPWQRRWTKSFHMLEGSLMIHSAQPPHTDLSHISGIAKLKTYTFLWGGFNEAWQSLRRGHLSPLVDITGEI